METNARDEAMADLGKACRMRAAQYALLSRLYEKEVDDELLDGLCGMKLRSDLENEQIDAAYRLMAGYLSTRWERTVEDLRIDYARVFFGNGMSGIDAAYPFESVHTSSERLMMQDARDEVLALFRAEGFVKSEDFKDNEDHMAMLLSYERLLCDKAAEAAERGDAGRASAKLEAQRNFLNDHLLNWVYLLAEQMEKFAQTDFYKALGLWTVGFLEEDEAFLASILDDAGGEADDGR